MSFDLMVHLKRTSMPTPMQWAQAIVQAGFPVKLETDFDVDSSTGFRPCSYEGELAGFEYYPSKLTAQDVEEMQLPKTCDFSVTFTTGANLREFATSLIAASVLCEMSKGVLFDPQAGKSYSSEEAVSRAKQELEHLKGDL